MHYSEFRAMNTTIVMAAEGDTQEILPAFEMARQFIEISEQRFTRFSEYSELTQVNRSTGTWCQVSQDMFEVLAEAKRLSEATGGLFDPAILPALEQAGYDRSIEQIQPDSLRISQIPLKVEKHDFRTVKLEPVSRNVRLPKGMQIDLGGIAKGWIAERAAIQLSKAALACAVSAGGDMVLIGLPTGEAAWEIGLEDPRQPEIDLSILHVRPGAVATSSIAKRRWRLNGQVQHHLIDPRTGLPAQTGFLSVTVWAEHAAEAEVYAKALLIAGPEAADSLTVGESNKAYLAVDKNGQIFGSKDYEEVFNVQYQINV